MIRMNTQETPDEVTAELYQQTFCRLSILDHVREGQDLGESFQ